MKINSLSVALQQCRTYERKLLKELVDTICKSISFSVRPQTNVLLKPNLVTSRLHDGIACTHPEFVAAVAEWFLDHCAKVSVGDSPAFGTAKGVMAACGITAALKKIPVQLVNFDKPEGVLLPSGFTVGIDRAALECDTLINLPKIKAHGQLLVSLAIKNYFGVVVGFRKPWIHARYGDIDNRFEALLVDLLEVLPESLTLVDGVVAMHKDGPVAGDAYSLTLIGGSLNPVAMDTALLRILGVDHIKSPLWKEASRRALKGSDPESIIYPLAKPDNFLVEDFITPAKLKPISFHPWRLFIGAMKRFNAKFFTK